MDTLGYHLVLRLGDDRVIAPSRAARRCWARRLAALTRAFPILVWKLADTHLHILVVATEEISPADAAAQIIRRLRLWVQATRVGVPLEVQRRKPLAGQSHLESAFVYVLRQDAHHSVDIDRYQDSSAVLDILGLRVLSPGLAERLRERMPRLPHDTLYKHLQVATLDEALHAGLLAESAAAAFGLDALGRDEQGMRARRAAVAAAKELGPNAIAAQLGLTAQTVCRLAREGAPPDEVRAVRLQMALRGAEARTLALPASRPAVREPEGPRYRVGPSAEMVM